MPGLVEDKTQRSREAGCKARFQCRLNVSHRKRDTQDNEEDTVSNLLLAQHIDDVELRPVPSLFADMKRETSPRAPKEFVHTSKGRQCNNPNGGKTANVESNNEEEKNKKKRLLSSAQND
ncbi:hypothetical protein OUZ56_007658 [Daphnia magna]|uniref:Uncharacterized protein n=1 Tax=Daphnia magna TaxID=35525 RepID=A0ABR0AAT5_9CRUS|nr:hypothetical protein OUZ56_007658 [Daphnia magna]